MRRFFLAAVAVATLAGCQRAADVASHNLSVEADEFRVQRKVTFYDSIQGKALLTIEGRCSLGNSDRDGRLSVTCKVGDNAYRKHFLGLSDNVTFIAEQLDPVAVSVYRYRVLFRPSILVPDIELAK